MEWIRHRPRAAAAAGVVAVLAVLALVIVLTQSKDDVPESSSLGNLADNLPTAPEPTLAELTPTSSPSSTQAPSAADVQKQIQKQFNQLGQGFSNGGLSGGQLDMPGLQGGSIYQYLPKHRVTMRVTSAAPIGTVGYVVPTSLKNSSGVVRNVGGSWSLTTTAYGDPDYAQIFLQADARGNEITCTITVDGKVTEKRTTQGPYARLICQG